MSTLTHTSPITVEQYLAFKAPPGFRDELIEGEIILSPDPKPLHQEIAHRICSLLDRNLEGTQFVARQRTNMQMPQDYSMPSPDVFVIDLARWKLAIAENGYPQQSPQLAIEVISRSNAKRNVTRKTALYLKNGALAVWLVYPLKKLVQTFENPNDPTDFNLSDTISLPPQLSAAAIPVKDIFDRP